MSESAAIQIYARIRPFKANKKITSNAHIKKYDVLAPMSIDEDDEVAMPRLQFRIPRDAAMGLINNSRENYEFRFDRVFDMDVSQEEVFDNVAKDVADRYGFSCVN